MKGNYYFNTNQEFHINAENLPGLILETFKPKLSNESAPLVRVHVEINS